MRQSQNTFTHMLDRMRRAAKLESHVYEEVESDPGAMGQAVGVVLLSSVAAGIGNLDRGGLGGLVIGTALALMSWYIWAYLTYVIGTRFLPEPQTRATPGELLRTLGFASTPGLIRVFGIFPGITLAVFATAAMWMLIAMVIAVRQALDYHSTWRAVGVCAIGWAVQTLILLLLFPLLGITPEPL
jgi:hypothetical protein